MSVCACLCLSVGLCVACVSVCVPIVIDRSTIYRKRAKLRWAKLLRYPHYMDFHGNTFMVQGQGTYMFTFRAKDSWEKLLRFSKKPRKPRKFIPVKLSLFMVVTLLLKYCNQLCICNDLYSNLSSLFLWYICASRA